MKNNCTENGTHNIIVAAVEGVGGGLGVIACVAALVFAIVSRFYKDVVQRLIVYKLITMSAFSLCQFVYLGSLSYNDTMEYRATGIAVIPQIFYYINMGFTFWLTVILYWCIVHLKELKSLRKLELIAVITSCLISPLSAVLIGLIIYHNDNESSKGLALYLIINYGIAVVLYFIISVLVVIIFIVTIRRSWMHHRKQNGIEGESLLVTDNKWKILSKQLLPLVVYPIVNTITVIIAINSSILFLLEVLNGNDIDLYLFSLTSYSGLITGTIIIIYLSRLKYIKKQRERKENERSQVAFWSSNHDDDTFTRETVASTDASTTYQYTRTSSFTLSALPVN